MGNKNSTVSNNKGDNIQASESPVVNSEIVQDGLVIWLDGSIGEERDEDCRNTISELQRVVKTIKTFTDSDQCIEFIETVKNEKAYMITSGSLGQRIVPRIHDMSQIDSIFIFCGDEKKHEQWAKEWSKVKGVHTEITPICDALKELVRQSEENAVISNDDSSKNLDQLDSSFMYTKIFKEILLSIEFEEKHIKNFIDYCREQFADNAREIENIKKFEQDYRNQSPIWWYTYECFLYPMLNRSLRLMDVDSIIKMGFFVRDLHHQIAQLHSEQFNGQHSVESFMVYHAQSFSREDFHQMSKKKGGLISFNGFLSTTKDRQVALNFTVKNPDLVGVLFVMIIDPAISTIPFASIENEEILFSMHTVFRICDIQPLDENHRLFQVNLKLTDDEDKDLRALTDRIREEISPGSNGWHALSSLLIKLDQYEKAQQMLEQTNDEREKADIYHQLGLAKTNQGEYEEAIELYQKGLEIRQRTLPSNHPDLISSYNSLGSVYSNMGEYLKALMYYDKVQEIQQ